MQPPYLLVRKNYDNVDTFNHDFLASPNLLVTRPFSQGGTKSQAVQALKSCLQKNLRVLQEGAYEPAWSEVRERADGEPEAWPSFSASPVATAAKLQR